MISHQLHLDIDICASTSLSTESSRLANITDYGMIQLHGLQIVYCLNDHISVHDEGYQRLLQMTEDENYRGCDVFLSRLWPTDILPPKESLEPFITPSTPHPHQESLELSALVSRLYPRYHYTSGSQYFARSPYENRSSRGINPHTRFLSLANVSASKEKHLKWLHALSLDPLSSMTEEEIRSSNAAMKDCTPNPYSSLTSSSKDTSSSACSHEPPSKRTRFDSLLDKPKSVSGSVFYDMTPDQAPLEVAQQPQLSGSQDKTEYESQSHDSKTLFIAGFAQKTRTDELEAFLSSYGCATLFRAEGKAFAFATFSSCEAAMSFMNVSESVRFKGRQLIINWKKDKSDGATSDAPSNTHRIVYFGGVPHVASVEDVLENLAFTINEKDITHVRRPEGKNFLFIEFASHNLARKVVETSGREGE